jgi:amino acid transporter
VITGATAIMYALAPISLAALNRSDPTRNHPYSAPAKAVLLPVGFIFANLIVYWGGFDTTWKLALFLLIGQVIFMVAALFKAKSLELERARWRSALWIWVWLAGQVVIGLLGQYGKSELKVLPGGVDDVVVAVFALVIFYWAVSTVQAPADVTALVVADQEDQAMQVEPEAARS